MIENELINGLLHQVKEQKSAIDKHFTCAEVYCPESDSFINFEFDEQNNLISINEEKSLTDFPLCDIM